MTEPKYDEDAVNFGYLKKVISDTEENIEDTYKNVSRHYATKPNTPYYKGDTWIDGNIVYTCINSREIGLYTDSDWTTESGAKQEAERKNKTYLTQPSNYSAGDMWILQSDNDHKAGKKGEILISSAGRKEYNEDDWTNMLGYGTIKSINEVSNNLNNAINRIGNVEEAIQDGIIITFYQSSIPEAKHVGDLWYVTDELEGYIKGKIYRYDGTNWVVLNDPAIQEAFDEANEARLVADGKIQSFYSNTEPTENMGVGDLWIDLANNNQLYRYNGTNWVAVYDTRINDLVTSVDSVTERVTTIETDLGEINLKVQENTTTITTIEGNVNNITNTQAQSEGKNIHIEDSAEEPFVEVELYGETSQKTRSGKNFFDKTKFKAINNATYTYSNGIYAITPLGTANVSLDIYINLPAGIYTYSGNGSNATQVKNSSGTTIANNVSSSNTTFTITEEGTYIRFNWGTGTSTDAFTLDTNNIQIEIGSTATDYEEYGVMPSPDYPSEIENIEGNIEFKVEGKNRFNNNFNDYIMPKDYRICPIKLEKGKVYRFNTTLIGTAVTGIVVGIVKNGVMYSEFSSLLIQSINSSGGINNPSFMIDDTWVSPKLVVYATTQTKFEEIFKNYNVQLVEGTEILDYEPYKSQVATFPLSEGQKLMEGSYLADDGIHHKRKQYTFTGNETFVKSIENNNYIRLYSPIFAEAIKTSGYESIDKFICTHFEQVSDYNSSKNCIALNGKRFYITISKAIVTDVTTFKTLLSEQYANGTPVIVEYELSEEETVPYTEQQEAWNKIKAMYTYKNITNITSDAYAKIIYMRDNGLDVYETKQNAEKNYTETTKKLAEQKITVDGIVSEVSETKSNINTINNNLIELNETVSTTEQRVNEYEIKFEEKTKTINEELKENSETIKSMSYTFNTDELSIAKSDDPVNAKINNSGMRVYSYNELKAIFNDKGTGIQKLIVVGSAQIGNLQIVKATDENGEACTDFHHLVSNIQELTDLEVG